MFTLDLICTVFMLQTGFIPENIFLPYFCYIPEFKTSYHSLFNYSIYFYNKNYFINNILYFITLGLYNYNLKIIKIYTGWYINTPAKILKPKAYFTRKTGLCQPSAYNIMLYIANWYNIW